MFSITQTVLLKPLDFYQPDRLVTVLFRIPQLGKQLTTIPVNAQHYHLWRDHARTMDQVAIIGPASNILTGRGESLQIGGARVSPNIFRVLGVQPVLGRSFAADEDRAGHDQEVILSDSFWREKLGGRRDVLAQQIRLNGKPFQVIGVMPAGFPFPRGRQLSDLEIMPERIDYWTPLVFSKDDLESPLSNFNYIAIARMKAGGTTKQLLADVTALERVISKSFPEPVEVDPVVRPLQQMMARDVKSPLLILMAAVSAVLLIVCINLMNLTMARATAQRRERAIRVAIGAGTRELLQTAFAESLLLSLTGGALGAIVAGWLLMLVRLQAPSDLPRIDELSLDHTALGFSLLLSMGSAVLFGLWPAWRAARVDPQEVLQASGRSSTEDRGTRFAGKLLVALEVALSTVLLLSAGLLVRSFAAVMSVDPGLNVQNLLTARVNLSPEKYKKDQDVQLFYRRLQEQLASLPGIKSIGAVSDLPLTGQSNEDPAAAGDRALRPVVEWPMTNKRSASGSYFETAGIPMKAGHPFEPRDGNLPEAVISEKLAARLWPGESAIGRPLKLYGQNKQYRVTGVVGEVQAGPLTSQSAMMVYFPEWQSANLNMTVLVRTLNRPEAIFAEIRRVVNHLEPEAAIPNTETMQDVHSASLAPQRFQMTLLAAFATAALLLACLGIYGVLSFSMLRRTPEIGIRMAMGARPSQILAETLRIGLGPVAMGIVAGLSMSAALARIMQSVLFEIRALDPAIYLFTALTLAVVALLACLIPARRAARLNPAEILNTT